MQAEVSHCSRHIYFSILRNLWDLIHHRERTKFSLHPYHRHTLSLHYSIYRNQVQGQRNSFVVFTNFSHSILLFVQALKFQEFLLIHLSKYYLKELFPHHHNVRVGAHIFPSFTSLLSRHRFTL